MKGFIEVHGKENAYLLNINSVEYFSQSKGGFTNIKSRTGEKYCITESYEEVKEKLRIALYGHITVREVREFCKSHIQENGDTDCSDCPFLEGNPGGKGESWQPYSCGFWNMSPSDWCGGDIARKIKEASND